MSCIEEDIPETMSGLQTVSVPLFVSIDKEDGTKAISAIEDKICNLWVIQFNGTLPSSKIIGEPTYIENYDQFAGDVNLVATESPCAICFVANTFEGPGVFDINARTTVEDMLNLRRVISNESQLLGSSSYTIFNDWMEQKIEAGSPVNVALKRNVAKVEVTVSVCGEALGRKMKITNLQYSSVPSVSYYVTDRAEGSELTSPFPLLQNFSKVNYPLIAWADEDQDNSMTLTAYLPVNMRGKGQGTYEKDKNKFAPDGATHLIVNAVFGDEGQFPITYTFYLGEDMVSDYDLKPNHSYKYNFNINSIGDADSDSRVTDWGVVKFTDTEKYPLSNSYILNPNPTEGQWRRFQIPLEKANIFWGDQGYENNYNNRLDQGDGWECFILASDFAVTDDNFKIESQNGTKDDKYFEVSVKSGVKGNVIVAAGKGNGQVSWSWHLWITDYDPYGAFDLTALQGQYIYSVPGGAVHRYADNKTGTFWTKESNSDVFIMDRNLGAYSDKYSVAGVPAYQGFIYYQYGRKDPFFVSADMYKIGKDKLKREPYHEEVTMAYSVMNPLSYIDQKDNSNESWIYEEKYNHIENLWNDPLKNKDGRSGMKSMFDPCPPGYRLPEPDVFNDLKYNRAVYSADINDKKVPPAGQETNTTNVPYDPRAIGLERGFALYKDVKGVQYWPYENDGGQIPGEVIFFPAMGHHKEVELVDEIPVYIFKSAANKGTWMSLWTSIPSNGHEGKRLFGREGSINKDGNKIGAGNMNTTVSALKARAHPVRCITDN